MFEPRLQFQWRTRVGVAERLLSTCSGEITGYDTVETTDENPERVAVMQRLSWASFHHMLVPDSVAGERARNAFATLTHLGRLSSK